MSLIILANVIFGDEDKEEKKMKKLILLFIVCVIFISCDKDEVSQNEDSDNDSKTEFDFDGSEIWKNGFSEFLHGFYIEEDSPIAIGSIVYKLSSMDENGNSFNPRLEVFLVDEILNTDSGKILNISRKYVYYSQSFSNEYGTWCRFTPQWRYIDSSMVNKFADGLSITDNFYACINKGIFTSIENGQYGQYGFKGDVTEVITNTISSWTDIITGSTYSGSRDINISSINEQVYSINDLKLLVDTFVTGFNSEEEKLDFIGKISEGFFDGNKSREPWLDMVLKYSKIDNEIVFDPFWRKNEVGLPIKLIKLDEIYFLGNGRDLILVKLIIKCFFGTILSRDKLSYYASSDIDGFVLKDSCKLVTGMYLPIIK